MSGSGAQVEVGRQRRTLRLAAAVEPARRDAVVVALTALDGVAAVTFAPDGTRLEVEYDVAHLGYGDLLTALGNSGVAPVAGRWRRFVAGLYQFMDENARANLENRPACCSKPPPGYRGRH